MQVFYIFLAESFVSSEKVTTFAAQKGLVPSFIGLWCNGNTADSGPAFPGSSPGSPTPYIAKSLTFNNLAIFLSRFSRVFPVIRFVKMGQRGVLTPYYHYI